MGWRDPRPALAQKNGAKTGGKGEKREEFGTLKGQKHFNPPPEPNWGGKGGEKGVQGGQSLIKPPELIKPPLWGH